MFAQLDGAPALSSADSKTVYVPLTSEQLNQIAKGLNLVWDPNRTAKDLAADLIVTKAILDNRGRFAHDNSSFVGGIA